MKAEKDLMGQLPDLGLNQLTHLGGRAQNGVMHQLVLQAAFDQLIGGLDLCPLGYSHAIATGNFLGTGVQ